jgi:hypothetical protein
MLSGLECLEPQSSTGPSRAQSPQRRYSDGNEPDWRHSDLLQSRTGGDNDSSRPPERQKKISPDDGDDEGGSRPIDARSRIEE